MVNKGKILVVDDNPGIRAALKILLPKYFAAVELLASPKEIHASLREFAPDVILLDMNFEADTNTGNEGLFWLSEIKQRRPQTEVVLFTAYADIALAVEGMKRGAFDFIVKPWENEKLIATLQAAIDKAEANNGKGGKVGGKGQKKIGEAGPSMLWGTGAAMTAVRRTVEKIAPTDASVLITGENGTGKDVLAAEIHRLSDRGLKPMVCVDAGAITETLFESELFGHVKGAFTDASADRIGRFEMANKGTIFLDEIGDLDPSCQVKLLRVLQDQTFEVLGDSRPRKVDVRVVSATNADLRKMVSERTFREDLFYRINLITVKLPSLRERREDIPLLARHFADRQAEVNGLPRTDFSADALNFLSRLPYPGNIRELKNLVERTILVSGKPVLDAADFDAQYLRHDEPAKAAEGTSFAGMTLDEIERQTILQALEQHKGNLSQVAVSLGISRAALYRRLEKYNIQVPCA